MKRIDQSEPPRGWKVDHVNTANGRTIVCRETMLLGHRPTELIHREWRFMDEAHCIEAGRAQPYVDDALARLVEHLQADASESRDDRYCNGVTAAIDLIESGEWRNELTGETGIREGLGVGQDLTGSAQPSPSPTISDPDPDAWLDEPGFLNSDEGHAMWVELLDAGWKKHDATPWRLVTWTHAKTGKTLTTPAAWRAWQDGWRPLGGCSDWGSDKRSCWRRAEDIQRECDLLQSITRRADDPSDVSTEDFTKGVSEVMSRAARDLKESTERLECAAEPYARHLRESGWAYRTNSETFGPYWSHSNIEHALPDDQARALYDAGARWGPVSGRWFWEADAGSDETDNGTTTEALEWLSRQ